MSSAIIKRTRTQNLGLLLGPVLAVTLLVFLPSDPAHPKIGAVAALVALMATWWVTEAIPLAATSLLPVAVFPLSGVTSSRDVAGFYMNSIIFLYIGGFLIALAMEKWNLHRRIALTIILGIGRRADWIVLGFMLAGGLLSMWISNTATAVMMLPIGLAIISQLEQKFGRERSHKLAIALLLTIAFSASIGGVATPVGTPTNLAFIKIFADTFPEAPPVSFGQWVLLGIPLSILLLFVTWFVLVRVACRFDKTMVLDRTEVRRELESLGTLSREERIILTIWILTAGLWIFRTDLNVGSLTIPGWAGLWDGFALVDDSTVAMLMALVLFVIPSGPGKPGRAILEVGVFRDLPWSAILLFGGGFALAAGFTSSGLTGALAGQFAGLGELPVVVSMLIACVTVALVTELVSNIAVVQMFIPVLAAWAVAQRINPLLLMVPATIMSSMAFMLPVGTPPNAVVFGSERITIAEMVRGGTWVKVVVVLITIVVTLLLMPLVFDVDPKAFPTWAAPQSHGSL